MAKVMIVSHRSQASDLLEALQREGICQILNAQEAMISKDSPELVVEAERPRDIEELLTKLDKAILFLKQYGGTSPGIAGLLAPRAVVDEKTYREVVFSEELPVIINQSLACEAAIEKLKAKIESISGKLNELRPWASLETPVEELSELEKATCLTGLLPNQQYEQIREQLKEFDAVVEHVGQSDSKHACLIVCLNEAVGDVQKMLRSAEFETVIFESVSGTVAELIAEQTEKLNQTQKLLAKEREKAASLGKNLLKLQIAQDHYSNVLHRETARNTAPATALTVVLEGWVKEKNYDRLEKIVSRFGASAVTRIEPAEGEEIPVEIENKNPIRPFEVITRLYGMPHHLNIDPTAFLAPFFALFFGLCLADAGYGLVMVVATVLLIKKMQGDKKLVAMFAICGAATIVVGALTGGWFGDAIQQFLPSLEPLRKRVVLFDPLVDAKYFLGLAVGLGYFQIMTGLAIAFVHNLKQKDYMSAVCNQLTWLVMLNSVVIFGAGKVGFVSPRLGIFFGKLAIVPALTIFLLSHREGGWGGRLGMGFFNLFSAIFYLGDVLSYLRLMALGMVGAGLAMAINVIAQVIPDILGQILGLFGLHLPSAIGVAIVILLLVGGHVFNLVLAVLGAFVHTLRLQYVEFFPKFLVGGGKLFEPLSKEYKYIYMKK